VFITDIMILYIFFDMLLGNHRYRKALRMMRHADHHGFPILTFIDTPGAYAGIKAEELGQVIPIAFTEVTTCLQNFFQLHGYEPPLAYCCDRF
jgi:hypothetical protein